MSISARPRRRRRSAAARHATRFDEGAPRGAFAVPGPEGAVEFAGLLRRTREHVAALLAEKEAAGVLRLHAPADPVRARLG